jgi:hypothetical protein
MNVYKIYNSLKSYFKRFDTIEEAQAYADSLGEGYSVEFVEEYTPPTAEERLALDTDFCTFLVNRFNILNREAGVTEPEALALLAKFKDILSMAQVGAINSVYLLLQNVEVDSIYTQARKDKDLSDIENYLNSFNIV